MSNVTELPSRTSVLVCAARAVGARVDDPARRNPDTLAIKLLGPEERSVIVGDAVAEALEQGTPELRSNPRVMGIVMTMIVRTKFIDEKLRAAVAAGAQQVVIMGAGWDTRAYRMADELRGVRVFEVDRAPLQEWKRRRIEQEVGPAPANLTYLQIDFRTQKLSDVLLAGGYDSSKKTFFIWEGVTMYLPEAAVRETLSWIAAQAPGSAVVFDFADKSIVEFATRVQGGFQPVSVEGQVAAERVKQLARWGEPWVFGIPENGVREFIEPLGLALRESMSMASTEAARRYLGWDQDAEFPAPIRRMYAIAEATVPSR